MEKIMELYKKYSGIVLAGATAYWFIIGFIGDLIGTIFGSIGLYIVVRLIYILIGLVGVVRLVEIFKPELLNNLTKKK